MNAKKIGLDTSLVLRLLTGIPEKQAEKAFQYLIKSLEKGIQPVVSDLVIAESYFALHYHYDIPKKEIIKQFLSFLESDYIEVEPGGVILKNLQTSFSGKTGLVDRIILNQYLVHSQKVVTFDKDFSQLKNVELI